MASLVSVCIPAYNRPAFLKEAIESCFAQGHRPLEIIIGDDSTQDAPEQVVRGMVAPDGVELRYSRNRPSRGQSGNVNQLFDQAKGSRLMLLHDDDLLCAGGLDLLVRRWDECPDVCCIYGKQELVDRAGVLLPKDTEGLNRDYARVSEKAGPQPSRLEAALLQQMPNNGFLIESALARKVRYRAETEIGQSVDADFSIRLAAEITAGGFVYVDSFTSRYRLSVDSIMRSRHINHGQHLLYAMVQALPLTSPAEQAAQRIMLDRLGVEASLDAAMAGKRKLAIQIMLSGHYHRSFLSHRTVLRLLYVVSPWLAGTLAGRRPPSPA